MIDEEDESSLANVQDRVATALSSIGGEWSAALLADAIPGGTLDAASALDVYREGYVVRLTGQLGEAFASVWRVCGDDEFFALCRAYVAAHPSTSYNLSDYGGHFAAFVATAPLAAEIPFLAELARFDWAFHGLFHAPAHEAVPVAELAALADLEGVRFRFGSAVVLFAGAHAVYDLFRHRHSDEIPDLDVTRSQRVLMFKQHGDVLAREVDAPTFAALDALARGLDVAEAIELALASDPGFDEAAVSRLFELIARCGLVAAVER